MANNRQITKISFWLVPAQAGRESRWDGWIRYDDGSSRRLSGVSMDEARRQLDILALPSA